jgi:hypothetical protein
MKRKERDDPSPGKYDSLQDSSVVKLDCVAVVHHSTGTLQPVRHRCHTRTALFDFVEFYSLCQF